MKHLLLNGRGLRNGQSSKREDIGVSSGGREGSAFQLAGHLINDDEEIAKRLIREVSPLDRRVSMPEDLVLFAK